MYAYFCIPIDISKDEVQVIRTVIFYIFLDILDLVGKKRIRKNNPTI